MLCLLAEGKTDQEIADALYLSRRTINTHVSHLLAKLQVSNRREASAMAPERGAADPVTARPHSGLPGRHAMDHPVQLVHIPGRSTTVDVYKYICPDGTTYDHDASWYEENCTGTIDDVTFDLVWWSGDGWEWFADGVTDGGGTLHSAGSMTARTGSMSRTASGATSPRTSSVTTATGWT